MPAVCSEDHVIVFGIRYLLLCIGCFVIGYLLLVICSEPF